MKLSKRDGVALQLIGLAVLFVDIRFMTIEDEQGQWRNMAGLPDWVMATLAFVGLILFGLGAAAVVWRWSEGSKS